MGAKHRLRIYFCGDVWVNKLSVFHDQIYSYPHSTSLSVIDIYMCRCTVVDCVNNYSILVETIPINIHIFTYGRFLKWCYPQSPPQNDHFW